MLRTQMACNPVGSEVGADKGSEVGRERRLGAFRGGEMEQRWFLSVREREMMMQEWPCTEIC